MNVSVNKNLIKCGTKKHSTYIETEIYVHFKMRENECEMKRNVIFLSDCLLVCVSYCWSLCFLPWLFYCYESLDIYKMYLICRNPGLDWNNHLRHDFDSGPLWCFSALWPDQVFPLKTSKHSHWWYYWMCSTEICECRWCCGESRQSTDEDDMRPFFYNVAALKATRNASVHHQIFSLCQHVELRATQAKICHFSNPSGEEMM